MKRRTMLKQAVVGGATLFFVPALLSSCEDETPDPDNNNNNNPGDPLTIDLADGNFSQLASPGGSVIVSGIIVINTGDGFLAWTASAPTGIARFPMTTLPATCPVHHGSIFSLTGSVLNGPAGGPGQIQCEPGRRHPQPLKLTFEIPIIKKPLPEFGSGFFIRTSSRCRYLLTIRCVLLPVALFYHGQHIQTRFQIGQIQFHRFLPSPGIRTTSAPVRECGKGFPISIPDSANSRSEAGLGQTSRLTILAIFPRKSYQRCREIGVVHKVHLQITSRNSCTERHA
ncbi:MAG: hypothetical protein R2751_14640 [Bacteroidales bacterium]